MLDPSHPEWISFAARIEARIAEIHVEMEGPLDIDETNRRRGAIGELRRIVSAGTQIDMPPPPSYA